VLNEHNTVFARSGALYATGVSRGPPVIDANTNGIAKKSLSLQPFLHGSLSDRPTEHTTRSVLSTATTSIYRSSRLDRRDQLQQSAAIVSCKTRRVAVYAETLYNVALKTAPATGVPDRWHNCLLIYWRTSCLVPAFDDTQCHVPATEWCQRWRYLPCYLLSVSNSI